MTRTTFNKAIEAAAHPILLDSPAQLPEAEAAWSAKKVLGIDTEFVRERTYRADLGLVQISDGETAWLVDPLVPQTLAGLERLMSNGDILKILHSGSEDLEVLLNSVGALPSPMIDSQIACALLGQPLQMGYHTTVSWLFDIEIDKDQTRSNWCRRPLHEKQLKYAAMDVVLLPLMLDKIRPRLEEMKRWSWLEEEVTRMQRTAQTSIDPDLVWMRIGGAGRLNNESLLVLRALARWREKIASERNRARGFVIPDAGLMQLAKSLPSTRDEIRAIDEIHPGALARYENSLLKLIAEAKTDTTAIEKPMQLDNNQRRLLNDMRKLVLTRSEELKVEPALLASRRELERLIRSLQKNDPAPERFLGWRKEVISDGLISIHNSA